MHEGVAYNGMITHHNQHACTIGLLLNLLIDIQLDFEVGTGDYEMVVFIWLLPS